MVVCASAKGPCVFPLEMLLAAAHGVPQELVIGVYYTIEEEDLLEVVSHYIFTLYYCTLTV